MPISQLLPKKRHTPQSALGVYNRIHYTEALELRRSAQLRQVKSTRVPPPPTAQARDALYLGFPVEDGSGDFFRNYVHPGAAAHLFDAGFAAALSILRREECNEKLLLKLSSEKAEQRRKVLECERSNSKVLLSTWTQNFFENETPLPKVLKRARRADDDDEDERDAEESSEKEKRVYKKAKKQKKVSGAESATSNKQVVVGHETSASTTSNAGFQRN